MSLQQSKIKTNKIIQQWKNNLNAATNKTYLLRNQLNCYSLLDFSMLEREYVDKRWTMFENFLISESPEELILKLEIAKCSTNFQLIDYLILCIGFSQKNFNKYIFNKEVIISLIDNYDIFDNAIKTPRLINLILKICEYQYLHFANDQKDLKQILAHIFKKFPNLLNMNFMKRKTKNGLKMRFTQDDIKKFF